MKKVLFLILSSLLVLGACGQKQDNEHHAKSSHKVSKEHKHNSNNTDKNHTTSNNATNNQSDANTNNTSDQSINQTSNASSTQQTTSNQNQQQTNDQSSQQQNSNEPSYQEYQNAKQLTQNIQNNPDKYQHIGGGPGMALSSPNQSYDSYKQDVAKMRNESQVLQQ